MINAEHRKKWAVTFYNSKTWRAKREHIKRTYKYRCQCYRLFGGVPCGRVATVVHHVKELIDYPQCALDDDNLLPLAWQCHERTKNRKTNKKPNTKGVRVIKV